MVKTKERKFKPTERQKLALDIMVGNGGIATPAMIEVGYSPNTANTPQKLTESKGFKQLCEERGLTEDFLVDALVEDIENKPQNRKAELELGFKVIGKLKEEPDGNKTLIIMVSGETAQRYAITPDTETSST